MNVGDAYQQTTGIFTAPERGVYYFSFFYHCSTSHETWLHLYRNGKSEGIAGQHKTEQGMSANGSNGLTLLLEKEDQVYILYSERIHGSGIKNISQCLVVFLSIPCK
ncbi:Complement C1q-like protein 4 [Labeo rohita]|uniref:Complement C1q-like protein 4 n=1 Tax=Labeo rohita TaxID=84645 RepID=A0ABQ8L5P9_LABRO|nr:Complement C1q-like protein 4 [Labeo rohita]